MNSSRLRPRSPQLLADGWLARVVRRASRVVAAFFHMPTTLLATFATGAVIFGALAYHALAAFVGGADPEGFYFFGFLGVFGIPLLVGSILAALGRPSGLKWLSFGALMLAIEPTLTWKIRDLDWNADYDAYLRWKDGRPPPRI